MVEAAETSPADKPPAVTARPDVNEPDGGDHRGSGDETFTGVGGTVVTVSGRTLVMARNLGCPERCSQQVREHAHLKSSRDAGGGQGPRSMRIWKE